MTSHKGRFFCIKKHMSAEIYQQINRIRQDLNHLEDEFSSVGSEGNMMSESIRKKRVFARQPGMLLETPEVGEFNVQVADGFMQGENLFDVSVIDMSDGIFAIDMHADQEFSVGAAEVQMELAGMEATGENESIDVEIEAEGMEMGETGESGAEAESGEGGEL